MTIIDDTTLANARKILSRVRTASDLEETAAHAVLGRLRSHAECRRFLMQLKVQRPDLYERLKANSDVIRRYDVL